MDTLQKATPFWLRVVLTIFGGATIGALISHFGARIVAPVIAEFFGAAAMFFIIFDVIVDPVPRRDLRMRFISALVAGGVMVAVSCLMGDR